MEKPYYQSIIDTLNSVEKPGIYTVGGETTMPLPPISLVGELDTILGLPLCESEAINVLLSWLVEYHMEKENKQSWTLHFDIHGNLNLNSSSLIILDGKVA